MENGITPQDPYTGRVRDRSVQTNTVTTNSCLRCAKDDATPRSCRIGSLSTLYLRVRLGVPPPPLPSPHRQNCSQQSPPAARGLRAVAGGSPPGSKKYSLAYLTYPTLIPSVAADEHEEPLQAYSSHAVVEVGDELKRLTVIFLFPPSFISKEMGLGSCMPFFAEGGFSCFAGVVFAPCFAPG